MTMPKIEKSLRREKKAKKDRYGMRESGRSVKTIEHIILRRAERAAREKQREAPNDAERAADDGYYLGE